MLIKNKFTKIFLAIFFSFFIVKNFTSYVFLANSPKINPNFIAQIKNLPENIRNSSKKLIAQFSNKGNYPTKNNDINLSINDSLNKINDNNFNNQNNPTNKSISDENKKDIFADLSEKDIPQNLIFRSISKNVSAAEDPETGKTYLKIKKGTKYRISGTVEINGKTYQKIEFLNE